MKKTYLYFLKDKNTGLFWHNENHYNKKESWKQIPRFFKSTSSLWASFNWKKLPVFFIELLKQKDVQILEAYNKSKRIQILKERHFNENFSFEKCTQDEYYRMEIFNSYIKIRKLNTSDILKMFEPEGLETFQMEIGESIKSAKKI